MGILPLGIRTAPVVDGIIGTVDITGGPGSNWLGPVPEIRGVYTGLRDRRFILTVDVAGQFDVDDTITVSWEDVDESSGPTGVLNLGLDHGFSAVVASDPVIFFEGMTINFSTGTLSVVGRTCAIECKFRRRLPQGKYRELVTDIDPLAVDLDGLEMVSVDDTVEMFDATVQRDARALLRNPSLTMNWMEEKEWARLEQMEQSRSRVTCFENYNEATVFLFRGGGAMPLIGMRPLVTSLGAYRDPISGLYREVAANKDSMRIGPGPTLETPDPDLPVNTHDRIPSTYHPAGSSIVISDQIWNMLPRFHPQKDDDGTISLGWEAASGATIAFDDQVEGVLDRQGGWREKHLRGTMRCELRGSAGATIRTLAADQAILIPGEIYHASVWIKGRGTFRFDMNAGPADPPGNLYLRQDFDIGDDGKWHECRMTVHSTTMPGGYDTGDLLISHQPSSLGVDREVFWISAAQITRSFGDINPVMWDSKLIETDGTLALESPDSFSLQQRLPPSGMLSFWYRHPPDSHEGHTCIVKTTDEHFILERDSTSGAEQWNWHTINTGRADAQNITGGMSSIPWESWVHIVLGWKWEYDAGADNYQRLLTKMWEQGVLIHEDYVVRADWSDEAWDEPIFAPTNDQGPDADWIYPYNVHFAEIRMDERMPTNAEALAMYNRIANPDANMLHRALAGRTFDITAERAAWLARVQRGKMLGAVQLSEVGFFEDNLVTGR